MKKPEPAEQKHSDKPTTIETPTLSPLLQIILKIFIGLHFTTALGLVMVGGYASSFCDDPTTADVYVGAITFISALHCM